MHTGADFNKLGEICVVKFGKDRLDKTCLGDAFRHNKRVEENLFAFTERQNDVKG